MNDTGPVLDWLRDRLDALLALIRLVVAWAQGIEARVAAKLDEWGFALEWRFWLLVVIFSLGHGLAYLCAWLLARRKT